MSLQGQGRLRGSNKADLDPGQGGSEEGVSNPTRPSPKPTLMLADLALVPN
jgi:hypothetical protein